MLYLFIFVGIAAGGYVLFTANQLKERMEAVNRRADQLDDEIKDTYIAQKEKLQTFVRTFNEQHPDKAIPVVTFKPTDKEVAVLTDQNLLQLGLDNGVDIATACGGVGNCGMCALTIHEGGENLTPQTDVEGQFLGAGLEKGQRLACQCQATGPVTVEGIN